MQIEAGKQKAIHLREAEDNNKVLSYEKLCELHSHAIEISDKIGLHNESQIFIYNEIIEIPCFGLNENTRRALKEKENIRKASKVSFIDSKDPQGID